LAGDNCLVSAQRNRDTEDLKLGERPAPFGQGGRASRFVSAVRRAAVTAEVVAVVTVLA
jgi:hypothetical protein